MDYTERGTIEKTFDDLITSDASNIGLASQTDVEHLVRDEQLSSEGRLYLAGFLAGMLITIRAFREDGEAAFGPDDADEINGIITRRERELVERLNGRDPDADD